MRSLLILVVPVCLLACRKDEPETRRIAEVPVPKPVHADAAPLVDGSTTPTDPSADAALAPTIDAGPVDYSQLVTAEWPAAVEFVKMERDGMSGRYQVNESYPRFRIRPKALADELNAKFAAHVPKSFLKDDTSGDWTFRCDMITVSRIAVIVRCGQMLGSWSDKDLANGTGGAPGGLHPIQFGYWLQPDLPPITIDQLAPAIDVGALIASANKIGDSPYTTDCRMKDCELDPEHFTVSTDGIALAPGEHCDGCADQLPVIPLAQLKPAHPWAKKLLEWIRKRAEDGEGLVKYEVTK